MTAKPLASPFFLILREKDKINGRGFRALNEVKICQDFGFIM